MITFSIKDLNGVADCVCYAGYQLVFARFALHNQEELRGLRHAFQKEKWLTMGGEHYQLNKETQLWPHQQIVKGKGVGLDLNRLSAPVRGQAVLCPRCGKTCRRTIYSLSVPAYALSCAADAG